MRELLRFIGELSIYTLCIRMNIFCIREHFSLTDTRGYRVVDLLLGVADSLRYTLNDTWEKLKLYTSYEIETNVFCAIL